MNEFFVSMLTPEFLLIFALNMIAIFILISTNLLSIIIALSAFSMLITLAHIIMGAPDVALTEASIGVFLSTVFLLMCIPLVSKKRQQINLPGINIAKITMFFAIICGLSSAVAYYLPLYGSDQTPAYLGLSSYYLAHNLVEIGIPSSVAGILASYRGFDTLGETLVITTAGIIVYSLNTCNTYPQTQFTKKKLATLLSIGIKLLAPIMLIFIAYIQIFGEVSPGGGFQAGAMAATLYFFYLNLRTPDPTYLNGLQIYLIRSSIIGFLIYFSIGLVCMLMGGKYLEYGALGLGAFSHKIGIFIIELGVGITVFSVMLLIAIILMQKNLNSKETI